MFACSTEDSPTIAWASVDYIDVGSQLEFAAFNRRGDMRTSPINPDTFATLIENRIDEDGRRILISELRLIVLPQLPMFSISCFHANGTGITNTIYVQGELIIYNNYNTGWHACMYSIGLIKNVRFNIRIIMIHFKSQLNPICHKM